MVGVRVAVSSIFTLCNKKKNSFLRSDTNSDQDAISSFSASLPLFLFFSQDIYMYISWKRSQPSERGSRPWIHLQRGFVNLVRVHFPIGGRLWLSERRGVRKSSVHMSQYSRARGITCLRALYAHGWAMQRRGTRHPRPLIKACLSCVLARMVQSMVRSFHRRRDAGFHRTCRHDASKKSLIANRLN